MIIVGAGGLATQLMEDLIELKWENTVFWTEVETRYPFIADHFPIISTDQEVLEHFKNVSPEFILCVGKDKSDGRIKLADRFRALGGIHVSYISPFSKISPYGTSFGAGTMVLNMVNIEPGVKVGLACLINKTANIGHGCIIGDHCELGPAVILTGEVEVGDNSFIGTGAIIHPKIKIGRNVSVSAGAVVTKHIADNAVVFGVPAQVKYFKK
ncbi:MAG: NeuD/PglB/VioB family sugar acetyltransferase, partial [Gemmatimonadaceae bacterium]|nr:NeuD/PglB/VioB family sugar acetyltransferase [Chitinophagaceae bacterium]